jgi:hypothetical protein
MFENRRKDSAYRVRDQASHPESETPPTVSRSATSVRPGSGGTIPPIPHPQDVPV